MQKYDYNLKYANVVSANFKNFGKFVLLSLGQFLDNLRVTVPYERLYEFTALIGQIAHLVPVFFIPVICTFDFGVCVAQLDCVIGVALRHEHIRIVDVDARKNLVACAL